MELAIRGSSLDVWPLGCFCLDKTAKALIQRPLGMAWLLGRPLLKIVARDTLELAIRGSNLDVATCHWTWPGQNSHWARSW